MKNNVTVCKSFHAHRRQTEPGLGASAFERVLVRGSWTVDASSVGEASRYAFAFAVQAFFVF
jgi:hypothetical protein